MFTHINWLLKSRKRFPSGVQKHTPFARATGIDRRPPAPTIRRIAAQADLTSGAANCDITNAAKKAMNTMPKGRYLFVQLKNPDDGTM